MLYAPDGAWMYVGEEPHIVIEGVDAVAYFPNILKPPCEKLELLCVVAFVFAEPALPLTGWGAPVLTACYLGLPNTVNKHEN